MPPSYLVNSAVNLGFRPGSLQSKSNVFTYWLAIINTRLGAMNFTLAERNSLWLPNLFWIGRECFNTFKRALQGEVTEDWFLLCWRPDGLNTSFYPLFFLRMIMIPLKVVWFSQHTCFLHCGIVKQLWGLCSIGTYSQVAMWNCFEALPYFIGLNMY